MIFLGALLFFNCSSTYSIAVWTTCNGVSGDASIWEGSAFYSQGDTVYINHMVRLSGPLNLDFNTVIITPIGELCGQYDLTIPLGSKIINYGSVCAATISLQDTLINYGVIHVSLFTITAGELMVTNGGSLYVGGYTCFDDPSCTPVVVNAENNYIASNTVAYEYYWVKDNVPLNENMRQIFVNTGGYYKVKIRKLQTDTYSEFSDSVYFAPMSIKPNSSAKENSIEIFPNPSSGTLAVRLEEENIRHIEIYDMNGELIIRQQVIGQAASVNIDKLVSGIYCLKALTENNVFISKIVKQ